MRKAKRKYTPTLIALSSRPEPPFGAAPTWSSTLRELPVQPRNRPQEVRVRAAISKLYPNGTDGFQTETIHAAVVKDLAPDSRARKLADPSRDTVARVLGRRSRSA
jgi:hypothetical protein